MWIIHEKILVVKLVYKVNVWVKRSYLLYDFFNTPIPRVNGCHIYFIVYIRKFHLFCELFVEINMISEFIIQGAKSQYPIVVQVKLRMQITMQIFIWNNFIQQCKILSKKGGPEHPIHTHILRRIFIQIQYNNCCNNQLT